MKCDEFKRQIMSLPNETSDDVDEHKHDCPECAKFVEQIGVFDLQVQDALQVPIPAFINDEFIKETIAHKITNKYRKISYAFAASLMFVIGIALFVNLSSVPKLEHMVIAHIEKEPFTLTTDMHPSDSDVKSTLASLGIDMNGSVGTIRFLKRCYLGEELVAHFVIEGQQGPVTVLLMPNESIKGPMHVDSSQLQGVIEPLNQGSSIAVVGYIGEPIKPIIEKAKQAFNIDL